MIDLTAEQLAELCEGRLEGDPSALINHFSMNSRECHATSVYLAYRGLRFDGHDFIAGAYAAGVRVAIVNELWPLTYPDLTCIRVADPNQALLVLARNYRRRLPAKIIAITGSNGKTATKDILGSILSLAGRTVITRDNNNNEIGVAQTLLRMDGETQYAVVEAGIDRWGDMDILNHLLSPDIGILTSVGNAHRGVFGSLEAIAQEKCKLMDEANDTAVFFYQGDEPWVRSAVASMHFSGECCSYGLKATNQMQISGCRQVGERLHFVLNHQPIEAQLLGSFQANNITAAVLSARRLNIAETTIAEALLHLTLTKMRMQIEQVEQAKVIFDAYKSNPESAQAALAVLQADGAEQKYAFFAGMLELGEVSVEKHRELLADLHAPWLTHAFVFGDEFAGLVDETDAAVSYYAVFSEFKAAFERSSHEPCTILVKGSRGYELERLLEGRISHE